MQELKTQAAQSWTCGMTEQGVFPKIGSKDSATLRQLNDWISYLQLTRNRHPKPPTKTCPGLVVAIKN